MESLEDSVRQDNENPFWGFFRLDCPPPIPYPLVEECRLNSEQLSRALLLADVSIEGWGHSCAGLKNRETDVGPSRSIPRVTAAEGSTLYLL